MKKIFLLSSLDEFGVFGIRGQCNGVILQGLSLFHLLLSTAIRRAAEMHGSHSTGVTSIFKDEKARLYRPSAFIITARG